MRKQYLKDESRRADIMQQLHEIEELMLTLAENQGLNGHAQRSIIGARNKMQHVRFAIEYQK